MAFLIAQKTQHRKRVPHLQQVREDATRKMPPNGIRRLNKRQVGLKPTWVSASRWFQRMRGVVGVS